MNKNIINEEISLAYDAIREVGIANEKGEVQKTFRGQVTSFGASVLMGSLLSSIAFFSDDKKASVDRSLILKAIFYILEKQEKVGAEETDLIKYAHSNQKEKKEEILNAATALKLAMNLYHLTGEKEDGV